MEITKIGIIGLGMVGGALDRYFSKKPYQIFRKDVDSDEGVNNADVIFISVPTPYDQDRNGYNLDAIYENLKEIEDSKIVVIKSTVTPGTTEQIQKDFPQLFVLFNPEFLTEHTADNDFEKPDRQIVGYTNKSQEYAQEILDILPQAPFSKLMSASEAEMVKIASNAFMSMKVIYYNQIYDICEQHGLSYDDVKEGVTADWRIGRSHSDVFHGGSRGFGGKCLPKDLNALIAYAQGHETLFSTIKEINSKLTSDNS